MKTKRLMVWVLCGLLMLTAMPGWAENTTDHAAFPATPTEEELDMRYGFLCEGMFLTVDCDMAQVLEQLGEPISYFEFPSCAFQGMDKTYVYNSFMINTYPDGETDRILDITLMDDIIETWEGAYIGCSKDAIISLYGEPTVETDSAISYEKEACVLSFFIERGIATQILYVSSIPH